MLTVETDLGAVRRNARYVKKTTGVPLCAVVKANAYGHGAAAVAGVLDDIADCFAVATVREAETLVSAGVRKDILILCPDTEGWSYLPANAIPTVADAGIPLLRKGRVGAVSVAVDTGMNRVGCRPEELAAVVDAAEKSGLAVHGVYTHFFNENDKTSCADQFDRFLAAMLPLRRKVKRFHCCASNCLVLPEVYRLDMVRAGLALYGYGYEGLEPSTRIYTDIVTVREVRAGEHVSYGNFTAPRDMRLATLRIGYGDGLRRGEKYDFFIGDKLCPTVGKICMDMCMVEVDSKNDLCEKRAFLLGNGAKMENFCKKHSTIPHEVLTMINERAVRRYVGDKGGDQKKVYTDKK